MNKASKQHIIGIAMLSITAVFWGAGFVLNHQLQNNFFVGCPALLNATRFVGATFALAIVFAKKLRFSKRNVLFGIIGGTMLFAGFQLQLVGLSYTTPAHCGFFTAAYIVFVPFMAWAVSKKRPSWFVFCGIALAFAGLAVLNINSNETATGGALLGDALTLAGAIMFAAQIVFSDYALKKDVDYKNLTFFQVAFAGILFVIYSLIFEHKNYASLSFDWAYGWWRILIVVFGGTAFAYIAQSYAQQHVSPSESSMLLACESPIGAVISLAIGSDEFSWTIIVGGLLVVAAVTLVEIVPAAINKKKEVNADSNDCPETSSKSEPDCETKKE